MKIKTMQEAENYLYNSLPVFHRQGPAAYKADIGNISSLMQHVGNPHMDRDKFIHIAGTNGKGSTAHLTTAYLQENGYKVGVYTSPHYTDIRERIKINGVLITEEDFVACLNRFLDIIEEVQPSFFEIICAMAFLYFKEQNVDYAVIETGMGGRLDSTNIITPILSVITNISFDHQQFLGDTLKKIAGEKAGIIKDSVPCIIGEKVDETYDVFIEKALSMKSTIFFSEDVWQCNFIGFDGELTKFQINSKDARQTSTMIKTNLHGRYQTKNIELFLTIAYVLDRLSIVEFNLNLIKSTLLDITKLTNFIGRWQTISEKPKIILESAHNIAGITEVTEQLKLMEFDQLFIIYGTVADKDISEILKILPLDAHYMWTKANIPRAMDENILKNTAFASGIPGESFSKVGNAIENAVKLASDKDLILIVGSIFIVGDALQYLKNNPLS